jgi:hypothetical protein
VVQVGKLTAYIVLVVLIYVAHLGLNMLFKNMLWFSISSGVVFMLLFARFVGKIEAKELCRFPIIGKWYNKSGLDKEKA